MDILTAIHTRRSVRAFTGERVAEEDVKALLDAAMIAPSAGNAQPWQFAVIDDRSLLEQIPAINPYAAAAKSAPLGILVCGDLQAEKYPGFWVQDCSAAIQNLLLAAVAKGLGTVWTGVHPIEERVTAFRALLGIPEHVVPLGFIVIGHPKAEQKAQSRFDEQKVHRNRW